MTQLTKLLRLFTTLMVLVFMTFNAYSVESVTEGTSFWFGIPDVHTGLKELPRGSTTGASEELFITSKSNTDVRIYNGGGGLIKTVSIIANELKIVAVPSGYQNRVSEVVTTGKSFYIESDQPISVVVYVAWYKTGETFKLIPVERLGTDYYTLNLYLDKCKMIDNGTIEGGSSSGRDNVIHPAQILIVATEDNTEVEYYPTANTKKVKAGKADTVTLNKGQTFLIQGDTTNPLMVQYEETDISGTRIHANKNIAVYSGHTKSAFPKFAPRYFGNYSADFLRNMLFETMLPVDMLGYEYVTAPIKWFGRTYQHLINDDEGDLIRFVATEDNTTLSEMKSDGSGWQILIKSMKKGQYYDILSRLTPGYFKSNNKILVGQYGKGWFKWSAGIVPKAEDETSKEDELQNPPYSGEGMLLTVTPNERWVNYADFASIPTQTNFFTLIFKTADTANISLDGENINATFGKKIKRINGTLYSYLSEQSAIGYHKVQSTNDTVLFAVYATGHTDAHKDGFAYGYQASFNYSVDCTDSLFISSTESSDRSINGTIQAIDLVNGANCAKIIAVKVDTAMNAKLEYTISSDKKTGNFSIASQDPTQIGYLKMSVISNAGTKVSKEFTVMAIPLVSNSANQIYELHELGKDSVKTINISNSGSVTLTIDSLFLSNNSGVFRINSTELKNIVLAPGASKPYEIIARFDNSNIPMDTAFFVASINKIEMPLVDLYANYNVATTTIGQDNWNNLKLQIDEPVKKTIKIKNNGSEAIKMVSKKFKFATSAFLIIDHPDLPFLSENSPVLIAPNSTLEFAIFLRPDLMTDSTENNELTFECVNNTPMVIPLNAKLITVPLLSVNPDTLKFTKLSILKLYTLDKEITNNSYLDVKISDADFKKANSKCNYIISGLDPNTTIPKNSSITVQISVVLSGLPDSNLVNTLQVKYLNTTQDLFTVLIPQSEVTTSVEELENTSTLPKGAYSQNSKILFENKDNTISSIKLWNEAGKLIKSYDVNSNNFELSTDDLSVGVYLYQVQFGNQALKGNFLITPLK